MNPITKEEVLTVWVDRFGRPCDSERHDAHPIEVVPKATVERIRAEAAACVDDLLCAWLNQWELDQEMIDQAGALRDRLEASYGS